ncbi:MAG: hypothetical protein QM503_04975 [Bacteroidota bacterium]
MRLGLNLYHYLGALLFVSLFAASGCYKFDGSQTIPAYVSIKGINVNTNYSIEGTNSSEIIDVWIYVDDVLIGVFEFPENDTLGAVFPVLVEGKHKLEIRPGIKINGISSTRVPYPFYKPIIIEDFDFIPGTTQRLGQLTTIYQSNLKFPWKEDFENTEISIEKTSWSDTLIMRTHPENNPEAFLSYNSKYSGIINLTSDEVQYAGTTYNSFAIQTPGTVIIMEMNFKTDNYLTVGLLIRDAYEVIPVDLLILSHTDEWTKIYINLGANLSLHPQAIDYKLIFKAGLESGKTESKIYIDNFKIVHR